MKFGHTASFALLLGSLALSALAGPALADARQDVLSATQRCAAFADDRTWLDCYYGAAQPMRAQLGLPPAPVAQTRLVPQGVAAAPAYLPPPTYVGPAGAASVPAYGIAASPSYGAPPAYGVPARPMNAGPQVAGGASAPPPLKHNRDSFFTSVFGGGKPVVANARMKSYGKGKDGRFIVTLTDGEIWQMDEADQNDQPQWRGAPGRYVLNIYEGALSSYNMEVSDDAHLYKVHRIN